MFGKGGPTLAELARQALSSTDRGYDLLAPKFEHTPFRTPDAVLKVAAQAVGPVDRALDVACGTGAAMKQLRPFCRSLLVGVDRSEGMLTEARRQLVQPEPNLLQPEPFEGPAISLLRADALTLPFRESFDAITCFGAFGHILVEDEPRFVRAIAQALRPGGRFVFVTADRISPLNPAWWMAKGFNAAMRLRNAMLKPEFVMYYLTFLLPRASALLSAEGFHVEVRRGEFPPPFHRLLLVVATR